MGILTHALIQNATIIITTTDKYANPVYSSEQNFKCRFRTITQIIANNNAETVGTADAIVWFDVDAPIVEGTVFTVDGDYWRVEKLVKPRRLNTSDIMFLKAYVNRNPPILGGS